MAALPAKLRVFVKQLVQLSLVNGRVSSEQVAGVLEYLEKNPPSRPQLVLGYYRDLIAAELAKGEARIEHAGPVSADSIAAIAAAMSRRYGRPVEAVTQPNPTLLGGLRVRVADDVFESSISGQLAALSASC